MLYRLFPLRPGAGPRAPGGALYVPRSQQGAGRHDQPAHYGVYYLSRVPASAVAELIQPYRGNVLNDADLQLAGEASYALAILDDSRLGPMVDLDDPTELAGRQLRPSLVATRDRGVTQGIALRLFDEGADGFVWWSTLESSWPNLTLFAERASSRLALVGDPELLTVRHSAVRLAAETLGVRLS